ncbi:MAG: response regulator transcription factor [Deltaproteobacteria bacterium]|nr:response regulator transcription factor [Deltaproteobacteria bacterium]
MSNVEMGRIRQSFLAGARERIDCARSALAMLGRDPARVESVHDLRRSFHWLGAWAAVHGLPGLARNARDGDDDVTRSLLSRGRPGASDVARWRALVEASFAAVVAAAAAAWSPADDTSRFLVLSPDATRLGGEGGPLPVALRCDVATSVDAAARALDARPPVAVLLDLRCPMSDLLEAVRLSLASGGPWRPVPPVLALGDVPGAVDRFRLSDAGVAAILPASTPVAEVVGRVLDLEAGIRAWRGEAYLLGPDPEVRAALERDLAVDGVRGRAFDDLPSLLRAWLRRAPDAVVACASGAARADVEPVQVLLHDCREARVPIAVVTTRGDAETRQALADAGADDVLLFPYAPVELASRISGRIDLRRILG